MPGIEEFYGSVLQVWEGQMERVHCTQRSSVAGALAPPEASFGASKNERELEKEQEERKKWNKRANVLVEWCTSVRSRWPRNLDETDTDMLHL